MGRPEDSASVVTVGSVHLKVLPRPDADLAVYFVCLVCLAVSLPNLPAVAVAVAVGTACVVAHSTDWAVLCVVLRVLAALTAP